MLANSPIVKQWFERVGITGAVLSIGLSLSIFVITAPPLATQSIAVVVDHENGLQRSFEVDAACHTAMADYYLR